MAYVTLDPHTLDRVRTILAGLRRELRSFKVWEVDEWDDGVSVEPVSTDPDDSGGDFYLEGMESILGQVEVVKELPVATEETGYKVPTVVKPVVPVDSYPDGEGD